MLRIKFKAIFLCNRGITAIRYVYSAETIKGLASLVDLDETVYTADSLSDQISSQTQVIFSTWGMPTYNDKEIKQLFPNLKIIFFAAGSVQIFAKPFLENGVRVVSAWAANAIPVAEFTLSQIILANKGYLPALKIMKEVGYGEARNLTELNFRGNFNCTTGIIGAGMIGRKVIELLKQCNIRTDILVYDPFVCDETAKSLGVTLCSLEELFEKSHVISNHLANKPQTVGLLNYELFRLMKPTTTFINTGRGAQVVEDDLIRALNEYPNRTALLDVTYPEPPETGHVFYKMQNVYLTAHISGSLGDEPLRMGEFMADQLEAYLTDKDLEYEVTPSMLETMA